MTVIAAALTKFGGAIVAADSMTTKSNGEHFPAPKLRRLPRRGIAGAAGDDEAVQIFLEWQEAGGDLRKRPRMKRSWNWEGILVTRDEILDFSGTFPFPDKVLRPFHAIGAGSDGALSVFAYQLKNFLPFDPYAAVEAVCEIHSECGPPVAKLTLKPRK